MKKLWTAIKSIVYCYTVQYLMCIGAIVLYLMCSKDSEVLEVEIIYKYLIVAVTVTIVPIAIYILKKYYRKESKISLKKLVLLIPLGFGISWFYNMLTINLQKPTELMNLNMVIIIIYTVILGPIFEELVFRYMGLIKAEMVYSKKKALLIITGFFAILHSGVIEMLYAFIIGLILGHIYQKEKNILYPITLHVSANLASIFVTGYSTIFLIISIILLGLVYCLGKKING